MQNIKQNFWCYSICHISVVHNNFKFVFWLWKVFNVVAMISTGIWLYDINKFTGYSKGSLTWTWWRSICRIISSNVLSTSRIGNRKRTIAILFERRIVKKSGDFSLVKIISVSWACRSSISKISLSYPVKMSNLEDCAIYITFCCVFLVGFALGSTDFWSWEDYFLFPVWLFLPSFSFSTTRQYFNKLSEDLEIIVSRRFQFWI